MKPIFTILATAVSLIAMASCEKFDYGLPMGAGNKVTPSKEAAKGFEQQIPKTGSETGPDAEVWDVEWDFEGTYWEVSFEKGVRPYGTEYTMYFDLDGNWLATETEILMRNLPQAVTDALKASEYGASAMDDEGADFIQTPSGEFYRFEIEVKGRDAEVDVTLDGTVTFVGYDY